MKHRNERRFGNAGRADRRKLSRQRELQKRRDDRTKGRANDTVRRAIKSGRLLRKPCVVCGNPKTHGHHEDYSKPLDVVWLCSKHHAQLHAAKMKQAM